MKTKNIATVADLIAVKKEIIDQIGITNQHQIQPRFVTGKGLFEITGFKSYNSQVKHFGHYSTKIGGRLLYDRVAVEQHLKDNKSN